MAWWSSAMEHLLTRAILQWEKWDAALVYDYAVYINDIYIWEFLQQKRDTSGEFNVNYAWHPPPSQTQVLKTYHMPSLRLYIAMFFKRLVLAKLICKKNKNTFISVDKALYLPTIWVNIWKDKTWIKKQSNSHAKDSSFCGTQELLKYVAKDSLKSYSQQFARQIMLHDSSIKLYGQLHGC